MGRRKGSKNRTAEERAAIAAEKANKPKGKRGRPVGSKNKPKEVEVVKKTGRPKGSKSGYTVSEKALAQRQNNLMIKQPKTDEERDYNYRLINHIMQINEIAEHADKSDLLSLKSCFIAYLQLCQKNGFNVSNLTAYASMGMDYPSFQNFSKRDDPEIKEFCKFVRKTCAMFRENMVANSKINPVIGIFWQRNFDGLRNDTEQVQSAQEMEEEYGNKGSYKEKYKNLIGG